MPRRALETLARADDQQGQGGPLALARQALLVIPALQALPVPVALPALAWAAQPPAQRIEAPKSKPPTTAPTGKNAGYVGLERPKAKTTGTAIIWSAIAKTYALTFVVFLSVTATRNPEFMQKAPRWATYP